VNKMYRFIYFLIIVFIPVMFGWWLFIPMALLYVYLARLPYEIILVGILFDNLYYFGDSVWQKYPLTIFSGLLIIIAMFLYKRIHWSKVI